MRAVSARVCGLNGPGRARRSATARRAETAPAAAAARSARSAQSSSCGTCSGATPEAASAASTKSASAEAGARSPWETPGVGEAGGGSSSGSCSERSFRPCQAQSAAGHGVAALTVALCLACAIMLSRVRPGAAALGTASRMPAARTQAHCTGDQGLRRRARIVAETLRFAGSPRSSSSNRASSSWSAGSSSGSTSPSSPAARSTASYAAWPGTQT